jgi:MraZ protein
MKSRFRRKSDHSLDGKGRLHFPSRFREVVAQYESADLMIVPWKKHLRIYPISEWEIIEDTLIDKGREEPSIVHIIRLLLAGAVDCRLDKQGRILLPAGLRSDTHTGKEVVLTGMRDWVEIWDTEAWELENKTTRENFDSFDEGLSKLGIF